MNIKIKRNKTYDYSYVLNFSDGTQKKLTKNQYNEFREKLMKEFHKLYGNKEGINNDSTGKILCGSGNKADEGIQMCVARLR